MSRIGLTEGGALNLGGPQLTAHLEAFAARLGFALHFEKTETIIPPEGGVGVRIYSNVDLFTGNIPDFLSEVIEPTALRAGSMNTEDQFSYGVVKADTGQMTMSYASFRLSFAVVAFSTMDRSTSRVTEAKWIEPGKLEARPLPSARLGFVVNGIVLKGRASWS